MLFRPGENCWQVADAHRVAFLVDGEAYFQAVATACEAARQAIYIIGWDVDSRICLRRGAEGRDETFGRFLDRLARARPQLHIHILEWDFAMLYSLEREAWPLLSLGWQTHERVHFVLDDEHPLGASHHQKLVVIDDRLAFVGGFDLASNRWDTPEHAPDQPGRCDNGEHYGPFHDVQMLVEGPVAAALGSLARNRWERATGEQLPVPEDAGHDPWPEGVAIDLETARVAILRTSPAHDGEPEAREIENFYRAAIDRAQSSIYIENQYLSSQAVGKALEAALRKAEGPEVLCVLPRHCSGWLEEETMGALRQRLLKRLQDADRNGRLKVCYPDHQRLAGAIINVHSKILIVDEALLTIGSANLSNRSMGFDTECNLALAADDQQSVQQAIAGLRNRLLAEHLGTAPEQVAARLEETGSLLATIAALGDGERSLRNLPVAEDLSGMEDLTAGEIADPERPIGVERLFEYLGIGGGPPDGESAIRSKAWRFAAVLVLALVLAALWRWSPLNQWLNLDTLLAATDFIRSSPLAIPLVLAIYVAGSCLMFPVTLMILATALSFPPITGFLLAFAGSLLGGLASYLLGHWLGRDVVGRLGGARVNRLSRKLARHGWLAVAVVRVVPIAPFTIVNLVAGATHITTRSFLIGTAVGMGPGILAIMIFGDGLERALREPGWHSLMIAAVALGCAALILVLSRRWLLRQDEGHER